MYCSGMAMGRLGAVVGRLGVAASRSGRVGALPPPFLTSSCNYSMLGMKAVVVGAGSEVGRPLCLMLKQSPWLSEVALYDEKTTGGLALELSQVDCGTRVVSYDGPDALAQSLSGAHLVLVVGGVSAALTPLDMLEKNATLVKKMVRQWQQVCPQAVLGLAVEPVNSLVPLACVVSNENSSGSNEGRILGVTAEDGVRAATLLAEVLSVSPDSVHVPVVGGSSPTTMVPLLSSATPCPDLSLDETVKVTRAVQGAREEVRKARGGAVGSGGGLCSAFALTKFAISVARALSGHADVVECAFIKSQALEGVEYVGTRVELGPCGVQRDLGIPPLSDFEECLLETALPAITKDIQAGLEIASRP